MEKLANLFFEFGRLKRIERSGWNMARVHERVESVAEHTCRTALIAYFLATLEGADPKKVALMALFHDVCETRVGDLDPLARDVLGATLPAAEAATQSQFNDDLPGGREIRGLLHELNLRESLEARIAKDADIIECALQAREYESTAFLESLRAHEQVHCGSSLQLLEAIRSVSPDQWWQDLRARCFRACAPAQADD
jgi:putative hydrolase of HD superfamily